MEDLFYSKAETIAFYVACYCDNSYNVSEIISMLEHKRLEFANMIKKARLDDIKTEVITKSRRYKYMRVFYCGMDECPEGAFEISDENGWTMDKWLTD